MAKGFIYLLFVAVFSLVHFSSCSNEKCLEGNEKVILQFKEVYFPFKGDEQLRFLYNKTDTHVFKGQGSVVYYVSEPAPDETSCPKDYECMRIILQNMNTFDNLKFEYIRDKNKFGIQPYGTFNNHTYYDITFRDKIFFKELSLREMVINNKSYTNVRIIGIDTMSNYIAFKDKTGIIKMVIGQDTWEIME